MNEVMLETDNVDLREALFNEGAVGKIRTFRCRPSESSSFAA